MRALVMVLDGLDEKAVTALNIATGAPLVYELDGKGQVLTKEILIERDSS